MSNTINQARPLQLAGLGACKHKHHRAHALRRCGRTRCITVLGPLPHLAQYGKLYQV